MFKDLKLLKNWRNVFNLNFPQSFGSSNILRGSISRCDIGTHEVIPSWAWTSALWTSLYAPYIVNDLSGLARMPCCPSGHDKGGNRNSRGAKVKVLTPGWWGHYFAVSDFLGSSTSTRSCQMNILKAGCGHRECKGYHGIWQAGIYRYYMSNKCNN